jgi:hypothetical protein
MAAAGGRDYEHDERLVLHHEMTVFHDEEKANAFSHVAQSKARVNPGALCDLMLGELISCNS